MLPNSWGIIPSTFGLLLKLNCRSNPVVKELQVQHGGEWSQMSLVYIMPPTLGVGWYESQIHDIASQFEPPNMDLEAPYRTHRWYEQELYAVHINLRSAKYGELVSKVWSALDIAGRQEKARLHLKHSTKYFPRRGSRAAMTIKKHLSDREADGILEEAVTTCKDGAGSILVEGLMLSEHIWKTSQQPGVPTHTILLEMPFRYKSHSQDERRPSPSG